jgi:hypothetical protein
MRLERSSGRAEGGATVAADVRLPGAAEQKVKIFCLPGFGKIAGRCASRAAGPPRFFLHMRILREEGNRGGKKSERERTTTKPKLMTSNKQGARMLMTMMLALFV